MQVVAIALIIAIGTGSFAAFNSMTRWRRASNEASYALLNVHDLRARLGSGAFLPAGTLEDAALEIEHADWIDAAEERVLVPTQVDASTEDGDVLVRGQLIGVDLSDGGPHVDGLFAERGRLLAPSDAGEDVVMLEFNFARNYGLPAEGEVRLAGELAVAYVGQALHPGFFMVVTEEGGFLAEANFAGVFTSLQTAARMAGNPGSVNDLVVRLTADADRDIVQRELTEALAPLGAEVLTIDDDPSFNQINQDVGSDQATTNVISVVLLIGAVFAAFNLTTRMIQAQRREIGIGMALGIPRMLLAARPLLVGAQIAVLGTVFGIGFGLLVGILLRSVMTSILPMPIIETPFQFDIFFWAAALGVFAPIIAIIHPVWRAVAVSPVAAIRTGHLAASSQGFSAALGFLPIPGGTFARMPVRNVLRTPQRTALTALAIAAVVSVLIGMLGLLDALFNAGSQSEEALLGDAPDRILVELDSLYPLASDEYRSISGVPELAQAEPVTRITATLVGPEDAIDVFVDFVNLDSDLWIPRLVEGEAGAGATGILLSPKAGEDLGVGVGDTIAVRHAFRDGLSFRIVETPLVVAGFHNNTFRSYTYVDRSQLDIAGLDGTANQISALPADGLTTDDVKRALFDLPGVASVQPVSVVASVFTNAVDDFAEILYVMVGVGVLLSGLIAFNSATINIDERRREHATMFAFGVRVRTVIRISVMENLILGVAATALGLIGGAIFIEWLLVEIAPQSMPDLGLQRTMSNQTVAAAFLVGTGIVAATPLLAFRRLRRMDIPSTLRVVE
jgi:putative ABC transport system permease protein